MIFRDETIMSNEAAKVWFEDGIVRVRVYKNKVSVDELKKHFDVTNEFVRNINEKVPTLVDLGWSSMLLERKANAYIADNINPEWYSRVAIVFHNVFQKTLASLFLGIHKPPVEIKIFGDIDKALKWLKESEDI